MSKLTIFAKVEPDGRPMKVVGRNAWALQALIDAGERGVSPVDRPALRWSAYIHKLRTKHGLIIETEDEPHGGDFAGTHARYRLHSQVSIVDEVAT